MMNRRELIAGVVAGAVVAPVAAAEVTNIGDQRLLEELQDKYWESQRLIDELHVESLSARLKRKGFKGFKAQR